MKINIVTTIELDKDVEEQLTQKDLDKAYNLFREIIKNTYESKDLTDFSFVNADTMQEIESEVEK